MRLFDDVASRVADPHLRRALELAERGRGATAPNPMVGCIVVSSDGRVVGEGFHPRAGKPHAEVFALAQAAEAAIGSTAYVTLEPCTHHGKTPPCADALIAAGVSRVVIGMPDPTVLAGGGAQKLQAVGVEAGFASDPSPFEALNEGWLTRLRTGRPFVTAKLGMSLDAHLSAEKGARTSMTGTSGREVTRTLRGLADAVLVGSATITTDDPELTVRDQNGIRAEHQPLRVVLARSTLPPAVSRVFTDGIAPTLLLIAGDEIDAAAVATLPDHVIVERFDAALGLLGALQALGERGVNDVLVEPGPRLFSALWNTPGALDALVTVTAGGMAGDNAPALFTGAPDIAQGSLVSRFTPAEAGIVGDISATVWRPARQQERKD